MMHLTPLPGSLRSSHPVAFIATWFGSGLMPKAPGTWGSLTAIPFAYIIYLIGGPVFLLVVAIIAFVIGIWASAAYALAAGKPDPSEVVIDEVAAMWLVLAFVPFSWLFWGLAFVSFRVFDVAKPWPVNLADAKLKGGFGIMFDDIIAAIYAIVCVTIFFYLMKAF